MCEFDLHILRFTGLWDLANTYGEENLKLGCETLLKKNLSMEKVAMMYSRAMTKKSNVSFNLIIFIYIYFPSRAHLKRVQVWLG